jgi:hypothetical protein
MRVAPVNNVYIKCPPGVAGQHAVHHFFCQLLIYMVFAYQVLT